LGYVCEAFRRIKTRQNSPKNGDFGSQVISISKAMKQGRHNPDWDMFVRHSEGLKLVKIRQKTAILEAK